MNRTLTHRSANRRALLIFMVMLAALVGAVGTTVSHLQSTYLHDEAHKQFQTELTLLGELMVEPLLRHDYAAVERLVQLWVERQTSPLHISVVMPNGFVLTSARNSETILHAVAAEQPVKFGEQTLLQLRAVSDISLREEGVSTIARNAALIASAILLLLGWGLWSTLQRTAIRPLEAEIEEHARKERELQQRTVDLETAIKELDSFSYSVSHDLRTPLRAIDGYCHILSQDYASVLDATALQYLARSRAAAQRMGQLIDDLLGLARMTQHELSLSDVNLSAMAREIVERQALTEPERQVSIDIAEGLTTRADPSLMSIVFDNLLSNAWKYTARRPGAMIEVGRMEQDGETVFFVRDNGAGFDMQYVHQLFRPFQRLHGTDYPGNGIGLAMVYRIIQRHGGRIWAESQPGQGATFFFMLNAQASRSTQALPLMPQTNAPETRAGLT